VFLGQVSKDSGIPFDLLASADEVTLADIVEERLELARELNRK
jgi:antitoxin component of RelBE/YafQ-DinJ toxin-antitoxin module